MWPKAALPHSRTNGRLFFFAVASLCLFSCDNSGPAPPGTAQVPSNIAFLNSLGMKFGPVDVIGDPENTRTVLFCLHETTNANYAAYAASVPGANMAWAREAGSGKDQHPVVNVSWDDASAFCIWLTARERKERRIADQQEYRLPSDHEWSCAAGLGRMERPDDRVQDKDIAIDGVYPWGSDWPPPHGAGNYDPGLGTDDFEKTSPVSSFLANSAGLFDLGGNVWEWCEDKRVTASSASRVLRGGSWGYDQRAFLLSSARVYQPPDNRDYRRGFRCVLSDITIPDDQNR